MKKILYSALFLTAFVFSCADEVENISRITYYPIFEFTGDEQMFANASAAYLDPGVAATEGGEPIEVATRITGSYFNENVDAINVGAADRYSIEYSAVNADNFTVTTHRTVWYVDEGDFAPNIEGLYISTVARNGVTPAAAVNLKYVIIKKTGTNTYAISDAIGGWYETYRAFGIDYAVKGNTFTLNNIASNDISSTTETPMGLFGGDCTIESMTFDPVNRKIAMTTHCVDPTPVSGFDYTFVSSLTQVDLF